MSLEGGRGGEGRGGEGRGGEGREGRGGGRGGRGGEGEGRDDCYTYYSDGTIQTNNEELYLFNNDVTYYVITCKSAFYWVCAAQQWYVTITFDVTHNNGTKLSVDTGDPPK